MGFARKFLIAVTDDFHEHSKEQTVFIMPALMRTEERASEWPVRIKRSFRDGQQELVRNWILYREERPCLLFICRTY
jgi:hypothetical protein